MLMQPNEDVEEEYRSDAEHPDLVGRRFILEPFKPQHHHAAYQLAISDAISFRWRFHGMVPTYEVFERTLHTNVFVQFAVVPRENVQRLAGLVVAYNANMQDGHAYVAAMLDRQIGAGTFEALALLVRYLLSQWPFRKLYMEAPEFNVHQFQTAITMGLMKEEGRKRDHRYYDGRYWDDLTFAMYREDAVAFVDRMPRLFNVQQAT